MKKLNSMTPEQEAQMTEYRSQWMKVGHSTDPLDLIRVEEVAEKLYALINQPKPQIVHCQSPWQMAMTIAAFKEIGKMEGTNLRNNLWNNLGINLGTNLRNNLRNNLGTNLWNNLGINLGTNLRNNLGTNLGTNLRNNLGTNLRNNLGTNLGTNLRNNLGTNLRNNLWNNLGINLGTNLGTNLRNNLRNNLGINLPEVAREEINYWTFFGPWYLYWTSFYDFPRKFLRPGVYSQKDNETLDIWIDLSHNVAGWAAYEGIMFVCERPTTLKLDSNNRLHCVDGTAIQYADGFEFYYLHGIHIENQDYILAPLTVEQIEAESNVEVRRVLIDKYGQAEYLIDSGAQKVHEDDFGVLYRKDIGDDEPIMMVKVVNSSKEPDNTYKDYWLGVDPKSYGGLKTAQAAVASTWRYEDNSLVFSAPEQYRPLVET